MKSFVSKKSAYIGAGSELIKFALSSSQQSSRRDCGYEIAVIFGVPHDLGILSRAIAYTPQL